MFRCYSDFKSYLRFRRFVVNVAKSLCEKLIMLWPTKLSVGCSKGLFFGSLLVTNLSS